MKTKIKVVALVLIFAVLCVSLCSCEILKLVNNILPFFHPEDDGDTNINIDISELFKCKEHVPVRYESSEPTCVASGFVGGYYCQKCLVQITPRQELPPQHKYDSDEDLICNVCNFKRPALCNHVRTESVEATESTCITHGHTAAERCVDCGEILTGYGEKPLLDHSYVDRDDDTCDVCGFVRYLECTHTFVVQLKPVEATCESTGLTSGWSCGKCGKIFLEQVDVPAIEHNESDWFVDKAPTESEEGKAHTECTACGTVLKTKTLDVILPGVDENGTDGLQFALNHDGNSYAVIGINPKTETKEIIIPKYYKGKPVTKIDDTAFSGNGNITRVTIPEGVLSIGKSAFRNCTSLKIIDIPSSVTKIGGYAFYDCALRSVTLPEGLERIEAYSFYYCKLTKIEIPDSVTHIGKYAFAECTLAEELILSAQ